MTRIALALVGLLALAQTARAEGPLVWAADMEGGAPYIYRDPRDPSKLTGFEYDLSRALERELGRPIEFRHYDYKSLYLGVERGDFDFAMNGLEVTPDRVRRFRLSRPYYVYRQQLVAREGDSRVQGLADARRLGLVVGTLEETTAERILEREGIPKKLYDGPVEAYRDLALSRIDAVLMDVPMAESYAKPDGRLRFVGEAMEPGAYAIVLRRDHEALGQKLDAALDRIGKSGELQRILEHYGLWNADQAALALGRFGVEPPAPKPQIWAYLPLLAQGAAMTVIITFASMALAIALGLGLALCRLYGPPAIRTLAVVYIELFRGLPVLLILYFLYYALPEIPERLGLDINLRLGPISAAILGLGLNYAAYEAEIYRGGIASIAHGQWEAARALGMSGRIALRRVILPQALRVILPPMTNDLVALFKDTSIVSVIAVVELSKQYQILSKSSMRYVELGLLTAVLYLVLSVPLGHLARHLERRWESLAR